MNDLLGTFVMGFNWVVLVYALAVNLSQALILGVAAVHIPRTIRRDVDSRLEDVFAHPETPAVSLLVPAHNEEKTIVESVRSVMALRYPEYEAVVVDDGSTDGTFEVLRIAYDLVEVPRVIPTDVETRGEVLSVHVQRAGGPLVVVRKVGVGRVADALNVALNAARHPLVCMVDADSVIEPDALLHVVKPFVEDPERVVAAGGVIRPSNGVTLRRGHVEQVEAPRSLLARMQVVEYLRAFLLGRVGWTAFNGVLIISGAFGVFRREAVVELGGMQERSLGQDAQLVASLHRRLRRARSDYRMVVVPQPVCWTEVPEKRASLARQRRRWSHGLAQVLWGQRRSFLRPRYGRFGFLVLPYYLLFELLGPVVELLGLPAVLGAWYLGLLNVPFAVMIFLASIGFGTLLSLAAVALEEISFHRYSRARDLARIVAAALVEALLFRPMHAWWRLRGLLDSLNPRRASWGKLQRVGFQAG